MKKSRTVSLRNFTGKVRLNADKTVSILGVGKKNPAKKSRFERCVKSVSARGDAYDPRGVCAAAGFRKYGKKKMERLAKAGKKRAARARARRKR